VKGGYARDLNRLAVVMLIAFAAASCGRKGALEPPPNASVTPKTSGAAAAADAAQTNGAQSNGAEVAANGTEQAPDAAAPSSSISSFRAKKPPPIRPPKTPFILDPLLE
jgi:predicted small lipoprotein YifL